ncbi:CehA/McbA family metallohydrolase [Sphingomonas azotifigens]|uniref:CehA/McbA family metallohydrolase n=1 Tax=Sphingomonas azotifigens TaxID=330920 RepID=UPI0009FFB54E|nr:CehA/McbA family metallohydrolase [Sphingomonas azotifigens]
MLAKLLRSVLFLAAMALPAAAFAQDLPAWDKVPLAIGKEQPDLVLTGTVDRSSYQRNLAVPFDVPKGVERIGVELTYTRPDGKTVINLGLFDGERFRGWSGSNKHAVVIDENNATPSFTPGPIGGRRWALDLGVSYIGEGVTSTYTARIWFWRKGDRPAVSTFSPEPLVRGTRWYRGDLHLHTGESDGFCDSRRGRSVPCPVFRTVDAALAARLDFIAVTDHNNVAHYNALRELQPYYDDILLIPGREMTTAQGHFNIFGTTSYVDYRLGERAMPDMATMIRAAKAAGAIVSINHPSSPSDFRCRGCGWTAPAATIGEVDAIEAMNAGKLFAQIGGGDPMGDFDYWEKAVAQGRRVTAVGGSDNHDTQLGRLGVGFPTTVVRASELSERAILDGIQAGHVWIDLTGKPGRSFDLVAASPRFTSTIGDDVALREGEALTLKLTIGGSAGGELVGLVDGHVVPELSVARLESGGASLSFVFPGDGHRHWIRFEVREGGKRAILTNPVYVNFGSPPAKNRMENGPESSARALAH